MRIGQKVKWFDSGINDFQVEDREIQRNRVYTIVKFINEEICIIADEFGESEVFIGDICPIEVADFNDTVITLKQSAIEKLKTLGGTMSFEHLYHEELDDDGDGEYYEDNRPQIIVANRHCEIDWTNVSSVRWDNDRKDIMVETDYCGEIPIIFAEGGTEIFIYNAILFN
jgi:hypothetical protein